MVKEIIFIILFVCGFASVFAIPSDPHIFYGDVLVDSKFIDEGKFKYFLNDEFLGTYIINNSKFGGMYDKLVISGGRLGDEIKFELIEDNCYSSQENLSFFYNPGEVERVILNFSGDNLCFDFNEDLEILKSEVENESGSIVRNENLSIMNEIIDGKSEIRSLKEQNKYVSNSNNVFNEDGEVDIDFESSSEIDLLPVNKNQGEAVSEQRSWSVQNLVGGIIAGLLFIGMLILLLF